MSVQTQNTNLNPYSNTPIKNLEYIQNKALVIAPFEITKSGLLDTDLMLDTPGTITMYFFRKNFNDIDKEPTAEQFKTVGTVSDISTKLGLDISAGNISSSITSSYYLGFTKISVIFKYDKNTGIRTIEKDNSLLQEDYIDIGIDNTIDLLTEEYFVICNVTKNTKATNTSFTESASFDFLFMIPSSECQEIITDFDILDANNKTINVKKYGALGSGFVVDNDTTIEPAYQADFFGDGSNIATYLFDGTCRDLNGNYNGTPTDITYGEGKVGQAAMFNGTTSFVATPYNPNNSTTMSISLWFKTSTINTNMCLFGDGNASGADSSARLSCSIINDNTLGITIGNNTTGNFTKTTSILSYLDGKFHNLIITYNINTVTIYIDNVLIKSYISTISLGTTSSLYFNIGKCGLYNGLYFTGSIDQVRIFNRALNSNEVTALYLNNASTRVIKQESSTVPTLVTSKPDFFKDGSNIATYLFNGNCNDETGSYNGTGTGITYTKGKFGQAATFSGSGADLNSSISLPKLIFGPSATSGNLSIWINPNTSNLNPQTLYVESSSILWPSLYIDIINGSQFRINIHNGIVWSNYNICNVISDWQHIYISLVGTNLKVYLNGTMVFNQTVVTPSSTISGISLIGVSTSGVSGSSGSKYTGQMDNVRIFNRALNQREVLELYNEQPSYEEQLTLTEVTGKTLTPSGNPLVVYDKVAGPSIKFDGSSYFTIPSSNDFSFGTGDFTVECLINTSSQTNQMIFDTVIAGQVGAQTGRLAIYLTATGKVEIYNGSYLTSTNSILYTQTNHIAITRINSILKIFINGVVGYSATVTTDFTLNNCTIGKDLASGGTYPLIGNLIQFHIIKGVSKYSTDFTPASRLLQTTNTVLLLQVDKPVINTNNWSKVQLESVEQIDQPYIYGSSLEEQTSKTLTSVGTTLIVDDPIFSKVLKFDGSNYINISSTQDLNFGTGDFTIETWMKRSTDKIAILFQTDGSTSGGLYLCHDASGYFGFGGIITSFATLKNTWYHIAMVRKSGTYKIFINGTCYLTATNNNSPSSGNLAIGTNSDWRPQGFEGYIYNLNIIKGEAKYQTDFKPNINFEKVVNTSLLIQPKKSLDITLKDPKRKDFFGDQSMVAGYMLDSNVNDETGMYNGTATNITYTDGKFGKCAVFNGSTSKISSNINLNNNNFSISFWGKLSNNQNTHSFILSTINGDNRYGIRMTNFGKLEPNIWAGVDNAFGVDANWSNYANIWTHYVFSIINNTCYFYINNELKTSKTFTSNVIFNGANIGYGEGGSYTINGQIDNVKIFNRALTANEVTSLYNEIIYDITLETESETIASEPDFFNDKSNIATYLFDNDVNDANGKYNGTATNITYGTGKFGNCAIFNKSAYIDTGLAQNSFKTITLSAWAKFNANTLTDRGGVFGDHTSDFKGIAGFQLNGAGGIDFAIGNGSNFDTSVSGSLTLNNWIHLVGIIDLTSISFYINGVLIGKTSHSGWVPQSTNILIGRSYNNTERSMNGSVDNVRIFNRALTQTEVQDLYRETKRVKYKAITLDETNFGPASKINIETQKEIKLLNYKTWTGTDATSQGYRLYPVMNISDHTTEETTFNPKYYLGTKYQRNLSEILSQGIKSKRTIFNLKDMYLVDDQCIQTLKKINILLENDQMIKFSERLYNLAIPLREKLNADLILEYLSTPVSGSQNSDITDILKTSLIEDYNFTQEEITNLNDNLNTFKSRARIALNAPVVQGSGLDQLRFSLPKTFIDGNRSKTEKKNLLVFGTNSGFNKFNLAGYSAPYSNVTKRDTSAVLDYNNLVAGLPNMDSKYSKLVVDDKTFIMYSGSLTEATGKTPTLTGVSLSTTTKNFNDSSIYINNSFITIPAGANLSIGTKDFTVETWINPTSIVDVPIFTLGLNQSQCCFNVQLLSNGAVLFRAGSGGWSWNFASDRTTAANLVKANTWNHIVAQRRNGNLEIYINGILYYTGVWAYNIPNGTNLYIGGYVGGSNITAYYDDISISNGVGRYTSNVTFEIPSTFKDILTKYKQQIPFTYIPLSTDAANTNNEPVFENLTDITGFNNSDIVIDIPNVL